MDESGKSTKNRKPKPNVIKKLNHPEDVQLVAARFLQVVANVENPRTQHCDYWGIENGLHWVLDVTFGEDANRTRCGNGAENLSILCRIALGMLNQIKGKKTVPNVKFRAAVDPEFRTMILKKIFDALAPVG